MSQGRMPPPRRTRTDTILGHLLSVGIYGWARTHCAFTRRLGWAQQFVDGLSTRALTIEERSALTLRLYGRRSDYGREGLFDWEEQWYDNALPPAPAKVLVGGCGSGREVEALLKRGYKVYASEPAPQLYNTARRKLADSATIWRLSYEHWANGAQERDAVRALEELQQSAPFDAVVLGWGSLSHVLDERMSKLLFRQLSTLCPKGPFLASLAVGAHWQPSASVHKRRGQELGQTIARLRQGTPVNRDGDTFLSHVGMIHHYALEDLKDLAAVSGRRVRLSDDEGTSRHCVFLVP